ncbi:hypothetical protein PMAYCL1PPCAC_23599, partial [Pristionchus mayeri]
MYIQMNGTFFAQTDRPDEERISQIAMSAVRYSSYLCQYSIHFNHTEYSLRNDAPQFATSTESNPFEVTESLMRDLTSIGETVFDTVVQPSTSSPIDLMPTSTSSIPLILSSTPRPPYYRIPDMLGLERDESSSRVEGESTLSYPPREGVHSNGVMDEEGEELPFIGDSTTFQVDPLPFLLPYSSSSDSYSISTSNYVSSLHFPSNRARPRESIFSFRERYFGTTEPSVDPPSLERLHRGFDREELVLFNS